MKRRHSLTFPNFLLSFHQKNRENQTHTQRNVPIHPHPVYLHKTFVKISFMHRQQQNIDRQTWIVAVVEKSIIASLSFCTALQQPQRQIDRGRERLADCNILCNYQTGISQVKIFPKSVTPSSSSLTTFPPFLSSCLF